MNLEKVKHHNIPERYGLGGLDLVKLVNAAKGSGRDFSFDLCSWSYAYGFQRGQNYMKNGRAKGYRAAKAEGRDG